MVDKSIVAEAISQVVNDGRFALGEANLALETLAVISLALLEG